MALELLKLNLAFRGLSDEENPDDVGLDEDEDLEDEDEDEEEDGSDEKEDDDAGNFSPAE